MARFWWQRGYRDGSYEKLPCLMEPRPASSKRHPLLAISDGGGTSGITELRRRKNCTTSAREGRDTTSEEHFY